jgi:hypothetical protein
MFNKCTDDQDVKTYTEHLFKKRNDSHLKYLKQKDGGLSKEDERDIDSKLKKWRLKERKHELLERII